jgi:seryl-tRNA synthetase
VLRKFFRTRMGSVIPVDVVEALMGHEGYLTEVYRRYSHEDLARFYSLGEAAVSVLAETEELAKLRVEVEERNRQLQALVNGLTAENMELKQRLQKLEQKLSEIEKMLVELAG